MRDHIRRIEFPISSLANRESYVYDASETTYWDSDQRIRRITVNINHSHAAIHIETLIRFCDVCQARLCFFFIFHLLRSLLSFTLFAYFFAVIYRNICIDRGAFDWQSSISGVCIEIADVQCMHDFHRSIGWMTFELSDSAISESTPCSCSVRVVYMYSSVSATKNELVRVSFVCQVFFIVCCRSSAACMYHFSSYTYACSIWSIHTMRYNSFCLLLLLVFDHHHFNDIFIYFF